MSGISVKRKKLHIDSNAILVYLIMFFSNDTYIFGTNSNEMMVSIARYLLIIMCIILMFKLRFVINLSAHVRKIMAYIVIVASYVVIANINGDLFNNVLIKILCMTVAFLLSMTLRFDEYVDAFRKAIYFISICAIGFTVFGYILPGVVKAFPAVLNTANIKIYTCGLAGLDERMIGQWALRTNGIFWEPGVFQMYLNMAIAYELLFRGKYNKKFLITEVVALLLTFSTTGYAVFAWILLGYAIVKNEKSANKKRLNRLLGVSVLFFIGVVALMYTPVGDVVLGKVINMTMNGTAMVRLAGVVTNIEIALMNPWHGIGMANMKETFLQVSMASTVFNGWTDQNTNTLLYQFAAQGIPYGILFTIGTFKFGNNFAKGKKMMTWIVFFMIVLLYIGENLQYSTLPYIFIFYGYGWKDRAAHRGSLKKDAFSIERITA